MAREEQVEPARLREAIPMYRIEDRVDDAPFSRTAIRPARPSTQDVGTLAGAFPDLAYLSDEDVDWAKQQWKHGVDKQVDRP